MMANTPSDSTDSFASAAFATPAGSGNYEVKQGECLASIAEKAGFLWKTLWDLPENRDLRAKRKDPNVLLPGDRLYVPEIRVKSVSGATERRHRFRLKGDSCRLRVAFLRLGKPRANEPYVLLGGSVTRFGHLDANGILDVIIPAAIEQATVALGSGADCQWFTLAVGSLDPHDAVSGAQGRLENLGYDCGGVDGLLEDDVTDAITTFQQQHNLNVTGTLDDKTCQALLQSHKVGS